MVWPSSGGTSSWVNHDIKISRTYQCFPCEQFEKDNDANIFKKSSQKSLDSFNN